MKKAMRVADHAADCTVPQSAGVHNPLFDQIAAALQNALLAETGSPGHIRKNIALSGDRWASCRARITAVEER
jgi:hypothetical protein